MKPAGNNPKKPISASVRQARRLRSPQERARQDLDAIARAYLEAGHLSPSDLKGEISMLRSVLRRVFELTSEVSEALEARQAEAPGEAPSTVRKAGSPRRSPVESDEEGAQLSYFADFESGIPSGDEGEVDILDLWVQTLESLGRGATRLANLMRTHQALNQAEPDAEETKAAEPHQKELSTLSEKLEQKSSDIRAELEKKD